jgi:prepilin-type N-terminal cleavage/methylation domain-containing protein
MARLLRRTSPSRKRPAGFTLVEVIVAMLISCVMITAVMGVAITGVRSGGPKNMRRILADQAISQLSGQLKAYVTACGCSPNTGVCPVAPCTTSGTGLDGPNSSNVGVGTWYLSGAPGAEVGGVATTIVDSQGATKWALTTGVHTLSNVLPAIEAAPYSGHISYTVTWAAGVGAIPGPTDVPSVTFNATWTEP